MTLKISVKSDARKLSKLLNKRQRKLIPIVMSAALNKTATQVQTAAVKGVAKKTGLIQKNVKPSFKRTKATPRRLIATIAASGRAINLIRLDARQTKAGVKARSRGKKLKLYPGTFIGNVGRTVFVRSRRRGGIRPVWGTSIPKAMIESETRKAINAKFKEKWPINFRSQISRRFGKTVRL